MACGGGIVQVWLEKWGNTRVCVPNLREMWDTRLVVAGLAAKARNKGGKGMESGGCCGKKGLYCVKILKTLDKGYDGVLSLRSLARGACVHIG